MPADKPWNDFALANMCSASTMSLSQRYQWKRASKHLRSAAALLPRPTLEMSSCGERLGSFVQYAEYIEHNELELALDELASLAHVNQVPVEFWVRLRDAAEILELTSLVDELDGRIS